MLWVTCSKCKIHPFWHWLVFPKLAHTLSGTVHTVNCSSNWNFGKFKTIDRTIMEALKRWTKVGAQSKEDFAPCAPCAIVKLDMNWNFEKSKTLKAKNNNNCRFIKLVTMVSSLDFQSVTISTIWSSRCLWWRKTLPPTAIVWKSQTT